MAGILVDTGILYAIADRSDRWHRRAVSFIDRSHDELVVPVAVLPEAAYLLNRHLGPSAERELVRSVVKGELMVEELTPADLRRVLNLLEEYAAARIGLVDASVVATAERLGITRLLTTDRRDFGLIRPRHCPALELLP